MYCDKTQESLGARIITLLKWPFWFNVPDNLNHRIMIPIYTWLYCQLFLQCSWYLHWNSLDTILGGIFFYKLMCQTVYNFIPDKSNLNLSGECGKRYILDLRYFIYYSKLIIINNGTCLYKHIHANMKDSESVVTLEN